MAKTSLPDYPMEQVSVENLYNLSINKNPDKTTIVMQLLIPEVNTRDFPLTQQILKLYLPSVLQSTCYNDSHIPFPKEVCQTEVGHLFEHILLEYLCLVKMEHGCDNVCYEGVTDWNWIQDPPGTFHITIHARAEQLDMLQEALQRTITLMNIILTKDDAIHADLRIPSLTTRH